VSQWPIQAAAVVVAPVISFQIVKRHHLSVVGGRQQVPTGPKVRRDAAERGQESLRVPDRREAFHRPLALPGRLVRVLGAVEFRCFDRRCGTDAMSSRCATW